MSEPLFFRVRATDPKTPGARLRLEQQDGDIPMLVEETVLPERVGTVAHRATVHERIWLTRDELAWLHEATGDLLAQWKEGT